MKLEGFKGFLFEGTEEQRNELIAIHAQNGCYPYTEYTFNHEYIQFSSDMAYGKTKRQGDGNCKTYAEAKAYLLSFANPVEPAKPKRKKAVAVNQGFEIDDVRYTKTHINYIPVAEVKQQLKSLRLKLDRHTRLDKAGALDDR